MNIKEYQKLENWIKKIDDKLDNHLISVGKDIARITNDMDWIKRFFWLIATISVGAILTTVFSVIFR